MDPLIGVMDAALIANEAVEAHNAWLQVDGCPRCGHPVSMGTFHRNGGDRECIIVDAYTGKPTVGERWVTQHERLSAASNDGDVG